LPVPIDSGYDPAYETTAIAFHSACLHVVVVRSDRRNFASDDELAEIDARLRDTRKDRALKSSQRGLAINYILLLVLMAMCIGVLFYHPTHAFG